MQLNLSKEKLTRNFNAIEKDGIMIILSSPSGAGKTTLVKNYLKKIILKSQYHTQQDSLDLMKNKIKTIFSLMNKSLKD